MIYEKPMLNILDDLKKNKLEIVAGDASFRTFYRIKVKNKKYILIYCTKEKKINLKTYASINSFLIKNKIVAPKLVKIDLNSNYMIVEDFGNKSYRDILNKTKKPLKYYKKIVDTLINIQKIKINSKTHKVIKNNYSKKILTKESNLFFQWYVPTCISKKKIPSFTKKAKKILSKIFTQIKGPNTFFVHRDFHVSNLMDYKKKVGIIDSQDALLGNHAYDIMSLIDDVRIKTTTKLKNKIFNYYVSRAGKKLAIDSKTFQDDFDILSVQRSLKIIGIFYRLYLRDGKKKYLNLIPYTWSLLHLRLKNPIFHEFSKILNDYLPANKRK